MKIKQVIKTQNTESLKKLINDGMDVSEISLVEVLDTEDTINVNFIELLIEKGIDVNTIDEDGDTPLILAVYHRNIELSELLINKGADVNAKSNAGHTPILLAADSQNIKLIKLLINNGANINTMDKDGDTPLLSMCLAGDKEIAKFLIENGADINIQDNHSHTALMSACGRGNIEVVRLLINNGADMNIQDHKGRTALSCTLDNPGILKGFSDNYKDIVTLLVEKGADVNSNPLALGLACIAGNTEIVQLMIDTGANVNAKDENGRTALFTSSMNIHLLIDFSTQLEDIQQNKKEIIKILINNGADVNIKDKDGLSVLYYACFFGDMEVIELLIKNGANINDKMKDNMSILASVLLISEKLFTLLAPQFHSNMDALYSKFEKSKMQLAQLLIDNGADVNYGIEDMSLLMICSFNKERLLENVEGNIEEKEARKTVIKSLNFGDINIARFLIENGADLDMQDNKGFTALMEACRVNNVEMVKLLIESGANVNMLNNYRNIPLIRACRVNNVEMVKLLLEGGANVNLEDQNGANAYFYGGKYKEIGKLLVDYGVNKTSSCIVRLSNMSIKERDNYFEDLNNNVKALKNNLDEVDRSMGNMQKRSIVETPMTKVLQSHDIEELKEVIASGYDTSFVDLFDLIKNDFSTEFIRHIVANGTDVNIEDKKTRETPLMVSVELNKPELVELLIVYDTDVNVKNNMGMTALMLASYKGFTEIVHQLLKNGADINVKSEMTAFDLAPNNAIKQMIDDTRNHTPQKLVKILGNFTIDKPIKFTTHKWDFGELKKEYMDFDGYMAEVKKQFEYFKDELKELSSNLYEKINTFLVETHPNEDYSWCSKAHINIGWSSLDGLKEWCDSGNDPFDFKLPKPIFLDRRTKLTTFGQIIELFKQEIEVRRDSSILNNIFIEIEERLGSEFRFTTQKIERQFYTDVEKLTNTLGKIFDGIKKHTDYKTIDVVANELDDGTIELIITHISSPSMLGAEDLLQEAEDGDFADIKANLTNLCDWSVEGNFEGDNFRVNYLKSNNVKDIEQLEEKQEGFTHILRFYKR